ncbi:MAG TPA: protein kinase [Archangium sp.]|uniref:nSTAND1 domain-containing NTPase n=1 Tax=Archangium sp. TaxID=1872627 RepID=UPI002ED8AE63
MERAGTSIGPYQLRRLVGRGGMAEVFAAVREHSEREVALKLLLPEEARDPQIVARFLQEGRTLQRLQHPGIVRVLDCGKFDEGTVFLEMELLQGMTLRERMRRESGPLPQEEALRLAWRISQVMVDVHAEKIVHRDLKPENVFLCHDEESPSGYRLKLLDFGIAKVPSSATGGQADTHVQTQAPAFLGTTTYMAPEQFQNPALVDGQADVYALGVMLFELLAGKPPFDSDEPNAVLAMHLKHDPPSLHEFAPTTPRALCAFIASMLAKEPAARPDMRHCRERLGQSWTDGEEECPLPGLAAFSEAQARLLLGREEEIDSLLGLLNASRTGRQRWVQLEGPGGTGKSSLVQAGLLPRLKAQASPEAPRWLLIHPRPSSSPQQGLALALHAAYAETGLDRTPAALEEALRADPEALRLLLTAHTPGGCQALCVIDPLEELFTLGEAERRWLDAALSAALVAPDSPLRLLTTLRGDLIHRLEQLPRLARHLNEAARYNLRPMDGATLTRVIQGLAQRAGLRLSAGLPELMVRDASNEGHGLPLLGHALRGLWESRGGAVLTSEHYARLGGVGGALARQAESLLGSLSVEGHERAKKILLDLVQVSRGMPPLRRSRTRQEVLAAAGGDALAEEVLLRLESLRLIMVSGEPEPSGQRVDLIHETLLHQVPSLVQWIEHERTVLERLSDLEAAAHSWEQSRCSTKDLPTGTLLAHYLQSAGILSPRGTQTRKLSERAVRFLDAARSNDRRRTRNRWALGLGSLLAAGALLVTTVWALQEKRLAQTAVQQVVNNTKASVSKDWQRSRRADPQDDRPRDLEESGAQAEALLKEDESIQVLRANIENRQRQGDVAIDKGTLAKAQSHFKEAQDLIERGLALDANNPDLRFLLGLNHSKQGKVVLALGGALEEARGHFNQALELFGCESSPLESEDHRRTCATSFLERADVERRSDRIKDAVLSYNTAIKLLEQNPGSYNEALLAEARAVQAEAIGDPALFDSALRLADSVSQQDPEDMHALMVLARNQLGLARLLSGQGDSATAESSYKKARSHGQLLHQREKSNKRYALVLAESLLGLERVTPVAEGPHHSQSVLWQERCALVGDFLRKDPEDARFQALNEGCPEKIRGRE